MILAYFSPEVTLPVASAVAASLGFIMLLGRRSFQFIGRCARAVGQGLRAAVNKLNV